MKLEFDIFFSKIKKEYVWLLVLIGLVVIDLILRFVKINNSSSSLIEFLSLIGFPGNNEYNITKFLIFIYEFLVVIYYVYVYYVNDLNNSFENVVLRAREKDWIKNKSVLCGLFVICMSAIYVLMIYVFFMDYVPFKLKYLVYPVTYHVLITYLVITAINFVKRKNYFIYPLIILFVYFAFSKFNIYISIILIALLLIINIKYFNFKRYYTNKN